MTPCYGEVGQKSPHIEHLTSRLFLCSDVHLPDFKDIWCRPIAVQYIDVSMPDAVHFWLRYAHGVILLIMIPYHQPTVEQSGVHYDQPTPSI